MENQVKKNVNNNMGIAGFVCGLCSASFYWIPMLGVFVCILAIIFSAIGIKKSIAIKNKRGRGMNQGLSITGLVLGIVFIFFAWGFTIVTLGAISALAEMG